jgi:hypothetical protein
VGIRSRVLRGGRKVANFDAVSLSQTIRIAGNVAPDRGAPLPQVLCLDAAGRGAVKTTHPTIQVIRIWNFLDLRLSACRAEADRFFEDLPDPPSTRQTGNAGLHDFHELFTVRGVVAIDGKVLRRMLQRYRRTLPTKHRFRESRSLASLRPVRQLRTDRECPEIGGIGTDSI